jgi:hypothetical protein
MTSQALVFRFPGSPKALRTTQRGKWVGAPLQNSKNPNFFDSFFFSPRSDSRKIPNFASQNNKKGTEGDAEKNPKILRSGVRTSRSATVQLPFGAFGLNARFAAKVCGGIALVCGCWRRRLGQKSCGKKHPNSSNTISKEM